MLLVQEMAQGLPEILLVIGALGILLWGSIRPGQDAVQFSTVAVVFLGIAFLVTFHGSAHDQNGFFGMMVFNDFTKFIKQVILSGVGAILYMTSRHLEKEGIRHFEYPVLVLLATAGMMVMVSANDLVILFVGLELQALSIYVLAAFQRDNGVATESAIKYLVLGSLSTVFILYGSSLIYGSCGSLQFPVITAVYKSAASLSLIQYAGLLLLLAGVAFKISLVPFHIWTPDVYHGTPAVVTGFLGSAPKVAGLALFIRLSLEVFHPAFGFFWQFLLVLSLLSMTLGAFAGLFQKNLRRLFAYSTISHMGYALMGLVGGHFDGLRSVLVYAGIYIVMVLAFFACLLCFRRHGKLVENIHELAGISGDRPLLAAAMAIILFSLAGIPPLAGFFAKYGIFSAVIQRELYLLAVAGILSSVVAAAYYLKIVKVMYFEKMDSMDAGIRLDRLLVRQTQLVLCMGLFVIVSYVFTSGWLSEPAYKAAKALFYRL